MPQNSNKKNYDIRDNKKSDKQEKRGGNIKKDGNNWTKGKYDKKGN